MSTNTASISPANPSKKLGTRLNVRRTTIIILLRLKELEVIKKTLQKERQDQKGNKEDEKSKRPTKKQNKEMKANM